MKNYTITVNGNAYDVTVEEGTGAAAPAAALTTSAPKAAPKAAPKKPAAAQGTAGSVPILAPMPGKVVGVKGTVGQAVKKGTPIIVLEAMKMENEIVASQDGTIASINVAVGDTVEASAVLATLN